MTFGGTAACPSMLCSQIFRELTRKIFVRGETTRGHALRADREFVSTAPMKSAVSVTKLPLKWQFLSSRIRRSPTGTVLRLRSCAACGVGRHDVRAHLSAAQWQQFRKCRRGKPNIKQSDCWGFLKITNFLSPVREKIREPSIQEFLWTRRSPNNVLPICSLTIG